MIAQEMIAQDSESHAGAASALAHLKDTPRYGAALVGVREAPASPPRVGPWPELHPAVRAAAESLGIRELYTHQAEAVAIALEGEPVVVSTGTASGKSLCYLLPILDALVRDPDATALLVFPTKALARDQLDALQGWDRVLDGAVAPAPYDGDTPTSQRRRIRESARVVVTNPDMLHTGILPHHPRWEHLFGGLRYLVLDEMHVYRGVFGSHVANVLRRLSRVARHYGSRPVPLMASATLANPAELGTSLTGTRVACVDRSGAPQGRRSLVFYNPPVVDPALNLRRSTLLEAENLARVFMDRGIQTIVFARSRQATELIARYIREHTGAAGADSVRSYRGGHLAGERREVESDLRAGRVRCVVATNALELGIDIGQLDACVMAGYPGSIASTWQQAGRAGRRAGHSVAVMVAGSGPLDQFIVRQPEYFFQRSPEHARIDPDNLLILLEHVRCAAFELPFGAEEAAVPFGDASKESAPPAGGPSDDRSPENGSGSTFHRRPAPPAVGDLLAVLEGQGILKRAGGTWYWMADAYPAQAVGLRSAGPGNVTVVLDTDGSRDVLGTLERSAAPTMVHPEAIYLHDAQPYRVKDLDLEAGVAQVEPADGSIYTRASTTTSFSPVRIDASREARAAHIFCGELEIRTRATAYRKIRFVTHETVGWGDIDLPEQEHVAGGYWFTLSSAATATLRDTEILVVDPSSDRGPDWPRVRDAVRRRDGYRCGHCGAPERRDRSHDVHHITPYAAFRHRDGGVDRRANDLDNLVTLCRPCHAAVERTGGARSALTAFAHGLLHVASLHLMCDPRDLGVSAEANPSWTDGPTVAVYERAAAGVGFGGALYELHAEVVAATGELIGTCPCQAGCPSCVGPTGPGEGDLKARALAVARLL